MRTASLVPPGPVVLDEDLFALVLLLEGRRTLALTGAGVSTESGIPDYRGARSPRRERRPVRYLELLGDEAARRRYWARAAIGWPFFAAAAPNDAHRALFALERAGRLLGLITQNVDRLHQKAGARRVVELHGALFEVVCLACGKKRPRDEVQARIFEDNSSFRERLPKGPLPTLPDGDAALEAFDFDGFVPPSCDACAGPLKPDVVFFGERVPAPRVAAAFALVDEAEALLVCGSSLAVHSGLRLVRRAHARGVPIAVINLGPSLADRYACVRVEGRAGDVLMRLSRALARR